MKYTYISIGGGVSVCMGKRSGTNSRNKDKRTVTQRQTLVKNLTQNRSKIENYKDLVLIRFQPRNSSKNMSSLYRQSSPVKKSGNNLNFQ